jgi:FtsZ-binding cell division protein ZapB
MEVEKLKLKVGKAYDRIKSGQQYREELKRLSRHLLLAKQNAQETFLRTVLKMKVTAGLNFISM